MSPLGAPYKSEGVSTAEVGVFAHALETSVFEGSSSSSGVMRESGLSLLNVMSAAIKSGAAAGLDELLDGISSKQRLAVGRVIGDSGVAGNAPTQRQRSEAQEIIKLLTE